MNTLKRFFFLFCFFILGLSAQKLPAGTNFAVQLKNEINKHNHKNPFLVVVMEDVIDPISRKVLIAKETPVRGQIVYVPSKSKGIPGELTLNLNYTRSIDGQTVLLSGKLFDQGTDRRNHVMGVGIGAGIVFPPMFFYALRRGGEPVLTVGKDIMVTVLNDYTIVQNNTIVQK